MCNGKHNFFVFLRFLNYDLHYYDIVFTPAEVDIYFSWDKKKLAENSERKLNNKILQNFQERILQPTKHIIP